MSEVQDEEIEENLVFSFLSGELGTYYTWYSYDNGYRTSIFAHFQNYVSDFTVDRLGITVLSWRAYSRRRKLRRKLQFSATQTTAQVFAVLVPQPQLTPSSVAAVGKKLPFWFSYRIRLIDGYLRPSSRIGIYGHVLAVFGGFFFERASCHRQL